MHFDQKIGELCGHYKDYIRTYDEIMKVFANFRDLKLEREMEDIW